MKLGSNVFKYKIFSVLDNLISPVNLIPMPLVNLLANSDIPLKVSVELGRTQIIVKDLLQLGQGSVLELDKLAGEPLEILVNGKLVAKGEVVVVNEKFGIRLTDIITPAERIRKLNR
jgi:flagellar motor switch protein FliN/FliY